MKPLYWKFILILGAMIVGASLVVPKALRKSAERVTGITAQTIFLENSANNIIHADISATSIKPIVAADKFETFNSAHYTDFLSFNFEIAVRFIVKVIAPKRPLNTGTKPVKSRVID